MNLPTWSTEQAPGIQYCTQRPCFKNNKNKYFSLKKKGKQKKKKQAKASKTKIPKQNKRPRRKLEICSVLANCFFLCMGLALECG